MVNYENGKIYKIEPKCEHEPHEMYYGSTTEERLCDRFAGHVSRYRAYLKNLKENKKDSKIRSYDLFEKYGVENCKIILLESVNAKSKDELKARESEYIKTNQCVNNKIPFVASVPYLNNKKEWCKEYKKEYYLAHQEEIIKKSKLYSDNNKEEIKERSKKQVECVCGCILRASDLPRHMRTQKHIDLMKTKKEMDLNKSNDEPCVNHVTPFVYPFWL